MDKQVAVNKVGHGLHVQDSVFKEYTESSKVAEVAHALGWTSPEVPQSMYIFKQPGIGGEVTPHQVSPNQTRSTHAPQTPCPHLAAPLLRLQQWSLTTLPRRWPNTTA